MREIKFRIWLKLYKKMEYVTLLEIAQDREGIYDERIGESIPIMQYTGLKDIKDKEIYEGDIIKSDLLAESSKVIFFIGCFFAWSAPLANFLDTHKDNISKGYNIEVIGNIYENPELLESN